jgi:hypothetical protein
MLAFEGPAQPSPTRTRVTDGANQIDDLVSRRCREARNGSENPMRVESNLLNDHKVIWGVQPWAEKYSAFLP